MLLRLTDERPDRAIREAIQAVVNDATVEWAPMKFEGEFPTKGFGITELRPKYVYSTASAMQGSAYWLMSISAASTWLSWIDVTITDMLYVVITGIFNLSASPSATEIFPSANGEDLPVVNIEQMYAWDLARGWFPKPFSVKPAGNLKVWAQGSAASTGEKLGLLGHGIGKRAYLITK
jgi:hypothetical protein